MRSFYFVLQLAFATLFTGVVITALTDLLWRNLPAGRTPESIISAMSVVGWFLTAASITIASTCPMDELDLNCFMHRGRLRRFDFLTANQQRAIRPLKLGMSPLILTVLNRD